MAAHTLKAQQPPAATEIGAELKALTLLPARGAAKLTVSTPAFADGGDIPFENTQYKGNIFPGLAWSAGPSGASGEVVGLGQVMPPAAP